VLLPIFKKAFAGVPLKYILFSIKWRKMVFKDVRMSSLERDCIRMESEIYAQEREMEALERRQKMWEKIHANTARIRKLKGGWLDTRS
jgi:hypothetical protein